MKTIAFAAHPLVQIFSFWIIIISGVEWGAPYIWYLSFGLMSRQPFAIIGTIAVLATFVSVFRWRIYLQPSGVLLMWISLAAFIWQLNGPNQFAIFRHMLPLLTMLLFAAICFFVLKTRIRWKSY